MNYYIKNRVIEVAFSKKKHIHTIGKYIFLLQ